MSEAAPARADAVIWLARHGQTDDNLEPLRIQGHRDVPLNAAGRQQARELAERVAGWQVRFASLHSSHLSRALETARIVGRRIGLKPTVDERLAETGRGDWEGRRWAEVARDQPLEYALWRAAGASFRFPGGESLAEQSARVAAALDDVRAGELPALVVCHGGTIRVALCSARGLGLERFHDFDVPNGSLVGLA